MTAERPPSNQPPTAFVSWAHRHASWTSERALSWQRVVLEFAAALRQIGGIDADLDLWHTASHENWGTFGVAGVRDSDFALIAVSRAYRERWEESGSPTEGAGAAREANAIKSIFERDRDDFRRRVKVVLLPGASIDDIPMELVSGTERFRIESFDLAGLSGLLRSLQGRPEFIKPTIGQVPALPPVYLDEVAAASSRDAEKSASAAQVPVADAPEAELLERRLSQVDAELDRTSHESPASVAGYERDALTRERQVLEATLTALRHLSQAASASDLTVAPHVEVDELEQALSGAREAVNTAQSAMSLLPSIAREALYQYFHASQPLTVGGTLDRCSVEDAIRAEENGYVNWVEDEEQTVSARYEHPRVDAAFTALQRLRGNVFSGVSWDARASAAPWAQAFLRTEYDIDDPEFELRPVWVRLGFLDEE